MEALRILNEAIRERQLHKFYLCVVDGIPQPSSATLTAYLRRDANKSTVQVLDRPGPDARTIVTRYRVIRHSRRNSLLEVELLTGRTHQIRAHMAHIGHPLLGDGKYGVGRINREYSLRQQLLYAYRLRFDFQGAAHLLSYLDGQEFTAPQVWFRDAFEERF